MTEKILTMDRPNPRQQEFLRCRKKYVAFGGARGGGKCFGAAYPQKGAKSRRSRGSGGRVCQKSLAEFAARRRQIKCNPFFAAACTSQKTLLGLQVWNLFAFSEQIMRAADCKPFVKKGPRPFLTS